MRKYVLAGVLAAAAASSASGAETMKPGLYNYTVKMEMPGMAMPEHTYQHCLTPADVEKGKQYQGQKSDCEMKDFKQSAGKVHYEMACKDGSTGVGDFTYTSDGMNGKTVMHSHGRDMTMNMSAARAGDCPK